MTAFVILGALLVLLALYIVVPPLLRPQQLTSGQKTHRHISGIRSELQKLKTGLDDGSLNQQDYNSNRQKLAAQVLTEIESPKKIDINIPPLRGQWAAWLTGLLIPAMALGIYAQLGSPGLISSPPTPAVQATSGGHGSDQVGSIEEMIVTLKQKLENEPENGEGWYMLARSYLAMRRFPEAVEALKKVVALKPDDANVLMQYGDTLAMMNDGRVSGEPEKIIHQALAINPNHPEALWLAGIAAEEQNLHEKAIGHWQKALGLMQDQPESRKLLTEAIEKARSKLSGGEVAAVAVPAQTEATASASIIVKVSLAPELVEKASPDDTVFIFARATQGPPAPLAAQRRKVSDLPFFVTLDDSQAMMPDRKLSGFDEVIIGARISSSGNPIAEPGDLEGLSQPLSPQNDATASVVIDKIKG